MRNRYVAFITCYMKSNYTSLVYMNSNDVLYSARHDRPVSISSTDTDASANALGPYPRKKDAFSRKLPPARSPQIPHRFSSVVLSRIVISRRGICVLSRLMREKRICQEFNQLGRTLIAEWQLSRLRPSESLVVKHGGVFDTVLLTSNNEHHRRGTDTSKSHF